MFESSSSFALKIVIEVLSYAVVVFLTVYIRNHVEPPQRGFFCNDESIMYPFSGDTIPMKWISVFGLSLPSLAILIGEAFHARNVKGEKRRIFSWEIPHYVSLVYDKLSLFLFGLIITMVSTEIAKCTIGRLRPHFLQLCMPNIDCSISRNTHRYIDASEFECTGLLATSKNLRESRLSFPSGHSSFAFYSMVYLALYLHLRVTWKGYESVRYLLEFLCLWVAWFTAMSRVSDFKHHWSDVLVGMALGTFIAFITFQAFCVAGFHKENRGDRKVNSRNQEMECTSC